MMTMLLGFQALSLLGFLALLRTDAIRQPPEETLEGAITRLSRQACREEGPHP